MSYRKIMNSQKEKMTVLALFALIAMSLDGVVGMKTTTRTLFPSHATLLLRDRYSFTSPGMVFGTCDETVLVAKKRSCTFVMETKKPIDSPDHFRVCDVTFQVNRPDEVIGKIYNIIAFGKNKAVVAWKEPNNFDRYGIIHFSDCRAIVAKINDNVNIKFGSIMAAADDMFDVVEPNYGISSCNNGTYCRLIINSEGNIVTDMDEWISVKVNTILAAVYSPTKVRLAIDGSLSNGDVRVMTADKTIQVLRKYSNSEKNVIPTIAISQTYEKLSICYQSKSHIFNCSQFNLNGNLQFENTLDFSSNIQTAEIHNLPDGGFMLLTESCLSGSPFSCVQKSKNSFVITKIDSKGVKVGSMVVSKFRFDGPIDLKDVHFFVNENNEYCLSHMFVKIEKGGSMDITITCFEEENLTNS
ncbi:uncharacterized protein LOC131671610 [Phymastichus coffea]|uniref:uncharacterized protein LOC131671610 n=1 Tax=Phymastichus coffea TaxID=108790 RepID=UPI00273B00C1|nr:uncharacterized protein LOC131671610 [Phymastichus coffea]